MCSHLCFQVFDSVSIFQCVLRLLETAAGWADVSYHDCVAVSTQSVFEQSCQFAVSVVDVLSPTAQRVDTVG